MNPANDFIKNIIETITPTISGENDPEIGEKFLHSLDHVVRSSSQNSRKDLAALTKLIYNEAVNLNYDIDSNGERQLITETCSADDVVFDVGANQGSWAATVLQASPGAMVHCFELIPETAKRLKANMTGTQAMVNACGLGDSEGTIMANYCPEHSELSGTFNVHSNFLMQQVKCRLTKGDAYCNRHRIDNIRLLKVDCEGAELSVLKGFEYMLRKGRIDVIQFEYGKANITARTLLLDFYRLLEPYGYVIGKLYPDGVDFRPYTLDDEDYTGPNYVACKAKNKTLVDRLTRFNSQLPFSRDAIKSTEKNTEPALIC